MAEIQTLIEMGFSKERAEKALAITNYKGVEPAMEWLLAHADDPQMETGQTIASTIASSSSGAAEPEVPEPTPAAESTDSEAAAEAEAKSFKCDECGKLFKNQDEMEFHAAKTNHSSFSESTEEKKPLTEEEKKAQLALLEERMKQKRKEREEREKGEALERERLRIKSGKDLQDAKQRMQEQEMMKLVEQRRREKIEDQKARDRVRAQIEADKQARKLAASGQPAPPPVAAPAPAAPAPATVKANYEQARIQLRLPDGKALAHTFGAKEQLAAVRVGPQARIQLRLPDGKTLAHTFEAKEQLAAVRLYLQLNAQEFAQQENFKLMTTFPKKIFTSEDYEKPLELLGLVPSAVIIVSKGT